MRISFSFKSIDNPVNDPLKIAHECTFILYPNKSFGKDCIHSIMSNELYELLKEVIETDICEVDADFCFDLRINKANLRYMC